MAQKLAARLLQLSSTQADWKPMAFLSQQVVQRELIVQRLSWRRILHPVEFAEELRCFLLFSELRYRPGLQKAAPQVELSEEPG